MLERWTYSSLMLVVYLAVFLLWKYFPSRIGFLLIGACAVLVLTYGMLVARRRGYFVNRVDYCLHCYVLADLFLETTAFEAFRLFQPYAVVTEFHDNNHFIGCTLAFALLIGGYRLFSGHRIRVTDGATYGQAGV